MKDYTSREEMEKIINTLKEAGVSQITQEKAEHLYAEFSESEYNAGWMMASPSVLKTFKDWIEEKGGETMNEKTIKDLCTEYGLGQSALARRFGVPVRTVQNWFHGVNTPPAYVVRMMDELLKIEKEKAAAEAK